MQTLHRARDRLVGERTALINQLRAMLLERGITVGQGRRELQHHLAGMNAEGTLRRRMFILIEDMRQWCEWIAALQLMSPEYVRPYVKSQKNDDRDAEAIAEARAAS